jgi:hypothetical protein
MHIYLIVAADVLELKEEDFYTQIISLKEGLARIEDAELIGEKRFMLAKKVKREDLFSD